MRTGSIQPKCPGILRISSLTLLALEGACESTCGQCTLRAASHGAEAYLTSEGGGVKGQHWAL